MELIRDILSFVAVIAFILMLLLFVFSIAMPKERTVALNKLMQTDAGLSYLDTFHEPARVECLLALFARYPDIRAKDVVEHIHSEHGSIGIAQLVLNTNAHFATSEYYSQNEKIKTFLSTIHNEAQKHVNKTVAAPMG